MTYNKACPQIPSNSDYKTQSSCVSDSSLQEGRNTIFNLLHYFTKSIKVK